MILTIFKIKHSTTRYQTAPLHHSTPPNTHYQNHTIFHQTVPDITPANYHWNTEPIHLLTLLFRDFTEPYQTTPLPYPTIPIKTLPKLHLTTHHQSLKSLYNTVHNPYRTISSRIPHYSTKPLLHTTPQSDTWPYRTAALTFLKPNWTLLKAILLYCHNTQIYLIMHLH